MPIFEFRCPSCGHQFEELVMGRTLASEIHCPRCLTRGVEKLLSVFAGCSVSSEPASASSGGGCAPASSRFS